MRLGWYLQELLSPLHTQAAWAASKQWNEGMYVTQDFSLAATAASCKWQSESPWLMDLLLLLLLGL